MANDSTVSTVKDMSFTTTKRFVRKVYVRIGIGARGWIRLKGPRNGGNRRFLYMD
jgi:hypothetical protein